MATLERTVFEETTESGHVFVASRGILNDGRQEKLRSTPANVNEGPALESGY